MTPLQPVDIVAGRAGGMAAFLRRAHHAIELERVGLTAKIGIDLADIGLVGAFAGHAERRLTGSGAGAGTGEQARGKSRASKGDGIRTTRHGAESSPRWLLPWPELSTAAVPTAPLVPNRLDFGRSCRAKMAGKRRDGGFGAGIWRGNPGRRRPGSPPPVGAHQVRAVDRNSPARYVFSRGDVAERLKAAVC